MPGYRGGTEMGSGRERNDFQHQPQHARWLPLAPLIAITLLIGTVPLAVWAPTAELAQAQDDIAGNDMSLPGQVIAQGIARLPRGEAAWTVRSIDVPGGEGMPVAAFPVGFAVADGATVALLDEAGEPLNILAEGQAAFLPNGKSGALASWEGDSATLYEIALVSGREVSAGETPGTIVGNPFAAPEGAAFDVEMARETLARDEEATIPISRSGSPLLYVQTSGSVHLEAAGGQIVELAGGQYAMLLGEVRVRGASDESATFVVAAIGEATAARDEAAGTPVVRGGREDRQGARDRAAQGQDVPAAERTREKRPKRVRTGGGGSGGGGGGGQRGQTAPQGTGGGGDAPISGGVQATVPTEASPGTPVLESAVEATPPADTTVPADGTPAPGITTPTDETAPIEETVVPDAEAPVDVTVTPESTVSAGDALPIAETIAGEPAPTVAAPPGEDTLPVAEAPAVETPTVEAPVEEAPVEPAAEEEFPAPAR